MLLLTSSFLKHGKKQLCHRLTYTYQFSSTFESKSKDIFCNNKIFSATAVKLDFKKENYRRGQLWPTPVTVSEILCGSSQECYKCDKKLVVPVS